MTHTPRRLVLLAAFALVLPGCMGGGDRQPRAKPLTPEAFSSPNAADAGNPGTTPGGTGPVDAGQPAQPAITLPLNGAPKPPTDNSPRPQSANDRQRSADNGPRPTVGASTGQFLTLGGVVAEVNGTPVYASKVLALLDPIFRTKARQMPLERFRREAADDIRKEIINQCMIELEVATAERHLDADDKRLAEIHTMVYRQRKITNAGGSLEVARRRTAQETGLTFEEDVRERSRRELGTIFYQKKIIPRIQVTANDVREFYDKNIERYTENEKVKFRILKIDFKKTGSKEAAMTKTVDKYNRVKAGEDFEQIVLRENDEPIFAKTDLGEMSPDAFAIPKVREALKKLRPGDVSEPIEEPGAYYVVQLVERKPGRVRPFEELAVQEQIKNELRTRQYNVLRNRHQQQLLASAVLRPSLPVLTGQQPPATEQERQMLNTALEMALQRYSEYASAK
jgi:parvulin-like peptidyl-prolyl isomerase